MTKRFKRPDGPLTQVEFDEFNSQRKRMIWAVIAPFAYACVIVAVKKLFDFEVHPAVHFLFGAPSIIWALVEMLKFKCPRCGTMPMTTRTSLGTGEIEVGSYVALRPKKCRQCGVLFEAPPQGEKNNS